jgi:hypothetical protein
MGPVRLDNRRERQRGEVAVVAAAAVYVIPGDLSRGVDGLGNGVGGSRSVENGVGAAAIKEAVVVAATVLVSSDDLTGRVDAIGDGGCRTGRIDGGVGAAAIEEAVVTAVSAVAVVNPDDLARGVDAVARVPFVAKGSLSVV